ncbi:hypothetical protein AUC47_11865 [Microbacterium sp. SZ1]|uniref:hypothetical protein n=1 Tax=Microbacterium sp. SZ1 TaxID=1849736 RepID=UPI000BBB89FE|nr:hypothetical protein [Microbacterium sp. SZ1]PCE15579.1 hypothetical protein AUC47_11865 [Microbacterium sp. SZ1]
MVAAGAAVALGVVPLIGSALSTSFQSAVQAVSQREMEAWLARMAEVVDALAHLTELRVDEIVGDGQFYQSLVRASRAAQETTDATKLNQLEAGVAHSGSWTQRSPLLERTLMRLLVQFEPEQIELLELVHDPRRYALAHPELGEMFSLHDVYKQVLGVADAGSLEIIGRQLNDLYMSGVTRSGFGPTFMPLRDNQGGFALTDLGTELMGYCARVRASPAEARS